MVLAKSKKSVGLGNSLMNDRFGNGKGSDMRRGNQGSIKRTDQNGDTVRGVRFADYHSTDSAVTVCISLEEGGLMGENAQCNGAGGARRIP